MESSKSLFTKVRNECSNSPVDWAYRLEQLGFTWVDDDDGLEETAEREAVPQNAAQELLVAHFEGQIDAKVEVLEAFTREKHAPNPNLALFRRYLKAGNHRLKALLEFGLQQDPADRELLDDIALFHSIHPMLAELIAHYHRACCHEADLERFAALAEQFHNDTCYDHFDAYHDIERLFPSGPKTRIVQELRVQRDREPIAIRF